MVLVVGVDMGLAIGAHYLNTANIFTRSFLRGTEKSVCKIQASVIFIYVRRLLGKGEGRRGEYDVLAALATGSQRINRSRSTTINQNYCGAISVCFLFALSGLFIKLMPNEIAARNLFVCCGPNGQT